jgi:hypothetical protein
MIEFFSKLIVEAANYQYSYNSDGASKQWTLDTLGDPASSGVFAKEYYIYVDGNYGIHGANNATLFAKFTVNYLPSGAIVTSGTTNNLSWGSSGLSVSITASGSNILLNAASIAADGACNIFVVEK